MNLFWTGNWTVWWAYQGLKNLIGWSAEAVKWSIRWFENLWKEAGIFTWKKIAGALWVDQSRINKWEQFARSKLSSSSIVPSQVLGNPNSKAFKVGNVASTAGQLLSPSWLEWEAIWLAGKASKYLPDLWKASSIWESIVKRCILDFFLIINFFC